MDTVFYFTVSHRGSISIRGCLLFCQSVQCIFTQHSKLLFFAQKHDSCCAKKPQPYGGGLGYGLFLFLCGADDEGVAYGAHVCGLDVDVCGPVLGQDAVALFRLRDGVGRFPV